MNVRDWTVGAWAPAVERFNNVPRAHVCVYATETKRKRERRGLRDTKKLKSTMGFRNY